MLAEAREKRLPPNVELLPRDAYDPPACQAAWTEDHSASPFAFQESRPQRRRGLQIRCRRGGGRRSRWEESAGPLAPASFGRADDRARSERLPPVQCLLACELSSSPPLRSIHLSEDQTKTQVGSSSHARCTSAAPRTRLACTRREAINPEPRDGLHRLRYRDEFSTTLIGAARSHRTSYVCESFAIDRSGASF